MKPLLYLIPFFVTSVGATIVIDSSVQKAEVFSVDSAGSKKSLGFTPLKLDKNPKSSLVVEVIGHAPTHILLASDVETADLKVELKPIHEWAPKHMQKAVAAMADKALDRIVHSQALLDERKIAQAKPLIESLMNDYPSSLAVKILYGNMLALSGNKKEAINYYKAVSKNINDQDEELKVLVDRILKALERRPASND